MTRMSKTLAGLVLSAGLALTGAAAYAHSGSGDHSMGPGMMGGMSGGMGHQSMTPQEHTALREKLRNAKSPEERQNIAQETHTRMQQRAKEKAVSLPNVGGTPPANPNMETSPK